jgi:hypothetical protein
VRLLRHNVLIPGCPVSDCIYYIGDASHSVAQGQLYVEALCRTAPIVMLVAQHKCSTAKSVVIIC